MSDPARPVRQGPGGLERYVLRSRRHRDRLAATSAAGAAVVVNARPNQLEAEVVGHAVEPAGGRTCPRQHAAVRRVNCGFGLPWGMWSDWIAGLSPNQVSRV